MDKEITDRLQRLEQVLLVTMQMIWDGHDEHWSPVWDRFSELKDELKKDVNAFLQPEGV